MLDRLFSKLACDIRRQGSAQDPGHIQLAGCTDNCCSTSLTYFLVDPLDGTREFIAGRDEFTVNIALMDAGSPLLGIVAAPAADLTWRGIVGSGAERMTLAGKGAPTTIRTRRRLAQPVVMISRSHLDADTKAYLASVAGGSAVRCGSSMKFCRVAEGSADFYPRLAPTHDWGCRGWTRDCSSRRRRREDGERFGADLRHAAAVDSGFHRPR